MYDDDNKPKTSKEEMDRMMKEFLDKGGKVEKVASKITKQMLERGKF